MQRGITFFFLEIPVIGTERQSSVFFCVGLPPTFPRFARTRLGQGERRHKAGSLGLSSVHYQPEFLVTRAQTYKT